MPIQELLSQIIAEHEALESRYDEVLLENCCLREQLAGWQSKDSDIELVLPQHQVVIEPLHQAPPPNEYGITSITSMPLPNRRISHGGHMGTLSLSASRSMGAKNIGAHDSFSGNRNQSYLSVAGSRAKSGVSRIFNDGAPLSAQERMILLLESTYFETLLVVVVILNIAFMWIDTNSRAAGNAHVGWHGVVNVLFLAFYILEFSARAFAFRFSVFDDKWNRFDLAVIITDTGATGCKMALGADFLPGFNASLLRLFRVFRIARLFKVFRFVTELQLLIHGFYGAIKAVFFATIMLEVMVLVWSFVFVEAIHPKVLELIDAGEFSECWQCRIAYSSMWNAHLTLLQQAIAGDAWGMVTVEVMHEYPETVLLFLCCLMSVQFAVLNLIFTVIVDAAARAREEDETQQLIDKEIAFLTLKDKLLSLCKDLDEDDSGCLTLHELREGYRNVPAFANSLASMDITEDDVGTIFMLMDEDRSGSVSYTEFVNNMYKMKEQDMNTTLLFVKGYLVDLRARIKQDMTKMLAETLRQAKASNKRMEDMSCKIEQLASATKLNGQEEAKALSANDIAQRVEEVVKAQLSQDRKDYERGGVDSDRAEREGTDRDFYRSLYLPLRQECERAERDRTVWERAEREQAGKGASPRMPWMETPRSNFSHRSDFSYRSDARSSPLRSMQPDFGREDSTVSVRRELTNRELWV